MFLLAGVGYAVFWALLAYPVVVTVGWGFLFQLIVIGWIGLGLGYFQQLKRIRSEQTQAAAQPDPSGSETTRT